MAEYELTPECEPTPLNRRIDPESTAAVVTGWRAASAADVPMLAHWNAELIEDEGERRSMSLHRLEERMRAWLARGVYFGIIFEGGQRPVAYALARAREDEVEIRQFFVARPHRRRGIGRRAIDLLFSEVYPQVKRWRVSVLIDNVEGIEFWRSLGFTDYAMQLGMNDTTPDRKAR